MAHATSMAELMAKSSSSIKSFKKSEKVTGKITKLTKNEILIDIGAKTEAVVLEKDKIILTTILSSLKEGDSVEVSVLNPESDQGNPVVSLRRFVDEKVWGGVEKLKEEQKVLEVNINEHTKGGFLVTTDEGISGFLPNSQVILNDTPSSFVGKKLKAVILEINRPLHKVIFSQKAATSDDDYAAAVKDIKVGDTVDVLVSNTTTFGVFVSIKTPSEVQGQGIEGFIHLSELSWDRIETAEKYFKTGEKIKAQVIGIDKEGKRINLSVKKLTKDPFEELSKEFEVDKKIKGVVKQVGSVGVTLDLGDVEGLIKKDKIPPSAKYSVGEVVEAIVSEIDLKRHKIVLVPALKEKPIGYR
jgi:small subunit ribosomal protein S1